jgi:arsenite methyltransferase
MAAELQLTPKQKRAPGEPCCEPLAYPDVQRRDAERMAVVAKALGDPIRVQLVDVLRRHAGTVCVCELTPLFDVGQPTVSHHLKVLRQAGVVDSERRGLWAYYYVRPEALAEQLTDVDAIREAVRARYAAAAEQAFSGASACCGSATSCCPVEAEGAVGDAFGADLYADAERGELPEAAKLASLGCGNPTAGAELRAGETVLDLGSGGGIDVLLSARRVGPSGKAYGLDMTEEMVQLARRNAREAGVTNVEFLTGVIEEIPLADASVDVVISNCVINLSADKPRVLREVARVLRPGGRVGINDVLSDADMDEATRTDMEQWTGCIAGALTRDEYERLLAAAGLEDIDVRETHRVHQSAGSAIVRACKPPPRP